MARTSSAAVLAALLAVAPATSLLAQTAGTTPETPPASTTATTPVVTPPATGANDAAAAAADAASTAASTAANTAADAAATASDAAAEAVGNATDAAAAAATDAANSAAEAADATANAASSAADAATAAGAAAAEAATGTATPAETPAATPGTTPAAPADATPATPTPGAPAADAAAAPANPDQQIGAYYTKSTHNAWTLRCLRTPDGKDPCELYQLLKDGAGKAVAEVSVIPFAGEAAAIMNFVAPLETDLEAGLGLQIDAGKNNRYPFLVCAPVGCVSRLGMTEAELGALKRGNKATLSLLPFGADAANLVKLDMSLSGFTAGFTELQTVVQATQAAPASQ